MRVWRRWKVCLCELLTRVRFKKIMGRKKLLHIKAADTLENVFVDPAKMAGKWKKYFDGGDIVLELACGHGHYVNVLGERFGDQNFIGVDKKADRIYKGAKRALDAGLKNVAFIRAYIEGLDGYFNEGEVDEIWITFPDPFPKPSKASRRLTSPRFLKIYRRILRQDGVVHLKTDNEKLFEYSREVVKEEGGEILEIIENLHGRKKVDEDLKILTFYEKKFLAEGKKIFYMKFSFL